MPIDINLTEIIVASLFILGGGGTITMKKLGFTISRNGKKPNAAKCPDPDCQSQVAMTANDVSEIKEQLNTKLWPKIDTLSQSSARVDERTEIMMGMIEKLQ